jgi:ABC-type spermidine/putrescine transport system permease subunit II
MARPLAIDERALTPRRGSRAGRLLQGGYLAIVLTLLVLPLVALIPMSFSPTTTIVAIPDHWSLRWYSQVLTSAEWRGALGWSVLIAAAASLWATTMGYLAADAIVRTATGFRSLLQFLVLLPLMVPQVVIALATYLLAASIGLSGSWTAIAIGQSLLGMPVATLIIAASLRGISDTVLRAATSLGASRWQVFKDVVLPMALHGILSAAALSFLIAFDELLVAVFLSTPSLQTLPVRVYQAVQYELTPVVAVVSVLLLACLSCGVIFGELYRWMARRTRFSTAASSSSLAQ